MPKQLNLPPGLRVRRGKLHYRFMLAGVEYSGSTGFGATSANVTRAVKFMATVREKAAAGEADSIKLSPKPFSDAVAMFNDWAKGEYAAHPATARRMAVSFNPLAGFFGRAALHSITPGQVEDFKAWRRANGIQEVTIRHDLHALSKLFQYGEKHGWCRRNVARQVTIPSDREAVCEHILTAQEEAAYFAAAKGSLADVARLILWQGMRPSEALGLRSVDVDLRKATVVIRQGKSAAARRVLQLTPGSVAICARRMATGKPWVFAGRGDSPLSKVNSAHDRACAKAGVSFRLYDLRHTFATRMAGAGCPLATLAAILGHANLRTIHRYVHPTVEAQHDAMRRFGGHVEKERDGEIYG